MALKLMFITNDDQVAMIAEQSGVDWIFIDLETIGKQERQGHVDSVKSQHSIADIRRIKPLLTRSSLLVRINPIHTKSKMEIEQVIAGGADIIMLPYFKTTCEVQNFIHYVDGKAKTCLLIETPEAVQQIESIIEFSGIDYIHIGLNDLHLGYGMKFMFELLANGTVEQLAEKIKSKGIPFGFGGIARLGQGDLPAECVIAEHYRLGSTMAILSRSFCNTTTIKDFEEIRTLFITGVSAIRNFEKKLTHQEPHYFRSNQSTVELAIQAIAARKFS